MLLHCLATWQERKPVKSLDDVRTIESNQSLARVSVNGRFCQFEAVATQALQFGESIANT